jgi:hypothetical protein
MRSLPIILMPKKANSVFARSRTAFSIWARTSCRVSSVAVKALAAASSPQRM